MALDPSRRLAGARLALLGAATAILQTLLAREFLAAFGGNEAAVAALLGPWLLWTALGSALGRHRAGSADLALLGVGLAGAASLLGARLLPGLFPAGAAPGASSALGWALGVLAAPCLLSGLAFARLARAAGPAWLAESLGSAAGGAALSLVLLGRVPPFALLGVAVALAAAAAGAGQTGRARVATLALGLALAVGLAATPVGTWALRAQGAHLAGAVERASPSAMLVLAGGALYADRLPLVSGPDRAAAEEAVHVPLGLHPAPRAVAVLGIPPAGALEEVLRHRPEQVDLVLDDEGLLAALREVAGVPGEPVRARIAEARRFLADRPRAYDAILLFAPEPTSAQLNRHFTLEAFAAARAALAPGGLFALTLPGHGAYAGEERRRLHSSVARTLEGAFGAVRVLPLGRTHYLATDSSLPEAGRAAEAISAALARRGIAPVSLLRAVLEEQLAPHRLQDARRWAALPEALNRDLWPTTYRLGLESALAEFGDLGAAPLLGLALLLAAGAALVLRPRSRPVELAVFTSGAAGIAAQLGLMLAYQIAAGALYREIGLLLAGFMLGAAAGAWAEGRGLLARTRGVLLCDGLQVLLLAGLGLALPWLVQAGAAARPGAFAASLALGLLPGAQFAAAGRALADRPGAAAALYAADLAGAALAALLTLTVVVPATGVPGAFLAGAGLKLLSTAALAWPGRAGEEAGRPRLAGLFPAALALAVLAAAAERTGAALAALTIGRGYRALAVALLLGALLAAFEGGRLRRRRVELDRRLGRGGLTPGRALGFLVLLPVAALPLGRCFFAIPYLFCHACPRPCVFGALRPYLIPAALLANLHDRRFCERVCPLGTAQSGCEALRGRRARRARRLALVRALALAFVAAAWLAARGEGGREGAIGRIFFTNAYAPVAGTLGVAAVLLLLSAFVRRPFCGGLCPVGAVAQALAPLERRLADPPGPSPLPPEGATRH